MQKHNKYLVWTIWVATIAFIGAGFVGWGSYEFGAKAGSVAKVGNIEIKQSRLNMAYGNLYNRYNEMFQGELDEKKAKELGIVQQAFASLVTQAKLQNYAQEMGIIVSDEEVAKALESIKGFQNKEGMFDKTIYTAFLQSRRMKAKTFEETLREELVIAKLLKLLEVQSLPLEVEAVASAMHVADQIKYRVLTEADTHISNDETALKHFWETHKSEFMTPKKYLLSVVWTSSSDTNVTEEEIASFYETNSFNYADASGKQLTLEAAKPQVTRDLKLKKSKKTAQRAYIAFKKGKREADESLTLPLNDTALTGEIWQEIQQHSEGEIMKPKVVADRYATIKIVTITAPRVMTFEEARADVTKRYEAEARQNALQNLAQKTLDHIEESNATILSPFIVVYTIEAQKQLPLDTNQTQMVKETVKTIKQRVFESNLIKVLDKRYPMEVYMGGLTN